MTIGLTQQPQSRPVSLSKSLSKSLSETFTKAAQYYPVSLGIQQIPAMSKLQQRCGAENVVERDQVYYNKHFAQGHTAVGMIDEEGQLVAHALIAHQGDETRMLNVLVDPAHRGQGLHKRMIKDWLTFASQQGYSQAAARVRLSAVASFKNFSAAGFESVRREPSPDAPHEMTDFMVKPLQAAPTPRTLRMV